MEDAGYQSDSAVIDPQEEEQEVKRKDALKGKNKTSEWRETLPPVGNEDSDDNVTDLVLIIHGIGQGVSLADVHHSSHIDYELRRFVARHY